MFILKAFIFIKDGESQRSSSELLAELTEADVQCFTPVAFLPDWLD